MSKKINFIAFDIALVGMLVYLISTSTHAAPPTGASRIIDGSYIVVFRPDVDTDNAVKDFLPRFPSMSEKFRYRHALRGMAVRLPRRRKILGHCSLRLVL